MLEIGVPPFGQGVRAVHLVFLPVPVRGWLVNLVAEQYHWAEALDLLLDENRDPQLAAGLAEDIEHSARVAAVLAESAREPSLRVHCRHLVTLLDQGRDILSRHHSQGQLR